jgi:hypothetical protein
MISAEAPGSEASASEIREELLSRLNDAMRHPRMYGREVGIELFLDLLAFSFGQAGFIRSVQPRLHQEQKFDPHNGAAGAFSWFWGVGTDDMAASIWAELSRSRGWLRPDRWLLSAEYEQVVPEMESWCARERTAAETISRFGPPSLCSGHSSSPWPVTLMYAVDRAEIPMISLHFWNESPAQGATWLYPESLLLGARREAAEFTDSFWLSPMGREKRSTSLLNQARSHGEA